jgi:hypothetical protein
MRRLFVFLAAATAGFGIASCNCGGNATFSCRIDQDCSSGQICQGGQCVAGTHDGGGGSPDSGNPGGNDSGNPPHDSGVTTLPDGGTCVGLQCQQSCPAGQQATITGTVTDPSGQLPLYDVFVYVPNAPVSPFPPGISCTSCGATISGYPVVIQLTDATGSFTLPNMPVGQNIPLVMQIGRWRREVMIPSVTCQATPQAVPPSLTQMPTQMSATDNIPSIALSSGSADAFECLFYKMGLAGQFTAGNGGTGRIHFFRTNGAGLLKGAPIPSGTTLYDSEAILDQYDVVILPCEGNANQKTPQELQNVVDYTNDGGRMFTTHFGYEWLGPQADGFGAAPFGSTADFTGVDDESLPDPILVSINQGFTKGTAFYNWLNNIHGLTAAGLFSVSQPRYDVGQVNATGPAFSSPSTAWMFGDHTGNWGAGSTYNWTPHMTFDLPYNPPPLPDGDAGVTCGRVVYSDFHVTQSAGSGFPTECAGGPTSFTPQEAALVFMLFDLSSCVGANGQPPPLCSGINGTCKNDGDCCAGLSCLNSTGGECNGGTGCVCTSPLG